MRVLVTGGTGFIGASVCRRLVAAGVDVVAALRRPPARPAAGVESVVVGDIDGTTAWGSALDGVVAVVHLAACTHAPAGRGAGELAHFRGLNVDGTRLLADQAARAGVARFVYMSSIKVNGERSPLLPDAGLHRFTGGDPPSPEDPYGRTKWEAEQVLHARANTGGPSVTVLRPPLVYGPGQKANLLRLTTLVDSGMPLPLGGIENLRSLIYVENLADAVCQVVLRPAHDGGTFTLADVDCSTPDLVRAMAAALGKPVRLFAVPRPLLRAAAVLMGRQSMLERLTGSLVVDSSEIATRLGWRPRVSFDDAMAATAAWFKNRDRAA